MSFPEGWQAERVGAVVPPRQKSIIEWQYLAPITKVFPEGWQPENSRLYPLGASQPRTQEWQYLAPITKVFPEGWQEDSTGRVGKPPPVGATQSRAQEWRYLAPVTQIFPEGWQPENSRLYPLGASQPRAQEWRYLALITRGAFSEGWEEDSAGRVGKPPPIGVTQSRAQEWQYLPPVTRVFVKGWEEDSAGRVGKPPPIGATQPRAQEWQYLAQAIRIFPEGWEEDSVGRAGKVSPVSATRPRTQEWQYLPSITEVFPEGWQEDSVGRLGKVPPVSATQSRAQEWQYLAYLTSVSYEGWQAQEYKPFASFLWTRREDSWLSGSGPLAAILSGQVGTFAIVSQIASAQAGAFRVQNNIEGYALYLGAGAVPDLTKPPAAFSATLPITAPVTPPGSGTQTYYALVRYQDTYGLQSQNQWYSTFTLKSSGQRVLNPLAAPMGFVVNLAQSGIFRISAAYPNYAYDANPANNWLVWVKSTPPNPLVDPPATTVAVNGQYLRVEVGSYTTGLWYVMVALSRTQDNALSPTVLLTIAIPNPPSVVTAVSSGYNT